MMAEIAVVITALTFLILVCGGLFLLYRPPTALRKFKFRGFEGEFQHPPPSPQPSPQIAPEPGTAEPAGSDPPDEQLLAERQVPADEDKNPFAKILSLFDEQKFKQGLDLAKQAIARKTDPASALDDEGFYLWLAFEKGSADVFNDLEKHAAAHPTNVSAQFWWGRVLQDADRPEEALKAFNKALEISSNETERIVQPRHDRAQHDADRGERHRLHDIRACTWCADAPSAMRMPISCVRWLTE